jgi:hypothetical protein
MDYNGLIISFLYFGIFLAVKKQPFYNPDL